MNRRSWIRGFITGVMVAAISMFCVAAAGVRIAWPKPQVIPVCPVKGAIGGFEPLYGNTIGNRWDKDEVTPFCEVKGGIGHFEPLHGNTIGNWFDKEQVKPFVVVVPDGNEFVPGGRL